MILEIDWSCNMTYEGIESVRKFLLGGLKSDYELFVQTAIASYKRWADGKPLASYEEQSLHRKAFKHALSTARFGLGLAYSHAAITNDEYYTILNKDLGMSLEDAKVYWESIGG